MIRKKGHTTSGSAEVRLISETVIECVLKGDVTGRIVEQSMKDTWALVEKIQLEKRKPRLLIDMSKITSQDSAARSRAKTLVTYGLEKIAVYGADRTLKTIGEYIARIAGMHNYTQFFQTKKRALAWLETERAAKTSNKLRILRLCAAIVGLIGIATLLGWVTNNETLVALSSNFKVMNPVTALNLVFLSFALFLLTLGQKRLWAKRIVIVIAGWLFIYGALILVRYISHVPIPIDTWLFTDKLHSLGSIIGRASPGTATAFTLISTLLLFICIGLKNKWIFHTFRLLTTLVVLLLLSVLIGYIFGVANLFDVSQVPMPLNTTIALSISVVILSSILYSPSRFPIAHKLFGVYGRGILVFSTVAFVTGLAWQQTNVSVIQSRDLQAQQVFNETESAIQGRINSYVDALHGFKAFFEGSGFVSAQEFNRYFTHSGLQKNYPGFNAISFIRVVDPVKRPQFEQEIHSQQAEFPSLKYFAPPAKSNETLYLLSYVEPHTANTNYGTNVGALPGRLDAFKTARDSGEPAASNVVSFTGADGTTEDGFIITIPVYEPGEVPNSTDERRAKIYGFVNAVFRSRVVFGEIFKLVPNDNTAFAITDLSENKPVYQTNNYSEKDTIHIQKNFSVGGQNWQVAMTTAPEFASNEFTRSMPRVVLISGLTLAVLASILVVSLSRRREEALALASSMTEDLNNERKLAEALMKKDDAILASIGDAVFAIDTEERITLFNPTAELLSGYKQEDAIGKDYRDILTFVNEDGKPSYSFIKRALGGHLASMKGSTKLTRKDGSFIEVADSAAPIRDAFGTLQGVIVVFRDVSSERALDRAKSEFVSLASHQLRTPLSAINWYSEMMLDQDAGKLSKDQREYMKEIYEGNQRMIELVDSLLNVSRLEVGKLKNDPQDVSMSELLESLEKEMQTSIVTKKLGLTKHVEVKLPIVKADPKLLRMIVQNLFSNAVKYTPPEGKVSITLRRANPGEVTKAKAKSNDCLFISISDTGYGIPKEQQEKIFEKLFRADNVRKMDVEGTGLGLYIVKEVARKLGGDIWFESRESLGTTFYVVIPFTTKPS